MATSRMPSGSASMPMTSSWPLGLATTLRRHSARSAASLRHELAMCPSDASFRLDHVEQAGARSRRETSDIGSADGSLIDPVDQLRGLAHMDALLERVGAASADRRRGNRLRPRNSQERHWQEAGHALAFGCCRPYDESAAAA